MVAASNEIAATLRPSANGEIIDRGGGPTPVKVICVFFDLDPHDSPMNPSPPHANQLRTVPCASVRQAAAYDTKRGVQMQHRRDSHLHVNQHIHNKVEHHIHSHVHFLGSCFLRKWELFRSAFTFLALFFLHFAI